MSLRSNLPSTLPTPLPVQVGEGHDIILRQLGTLSFTQRVEAFKTVFESIKMPLRSLGMQIPFAQVYPGFRNELLSAHLTYSLFTGRIEINWNPKAGAFVTDPRSHQCGMLIMQPGEQTDVRKHVAYEDLQLQRFCITVGSYMYEHQPLLLCYIHLSVKDGKMVVECHNQISGNNELYVFVYSTCVKIERRQLNQGQVGFKLKNLVELIALFRYEPDGGWLNKENCKPTVYGLELTAGGEDGPCKRHAECLGSLFSRRVYSAESSIVPADASRPL